MAGVQAQFRRRIAQESSNTGILNSEIRTSGNQESQKGKNHSLFLFSWIPDFQIPSHSCVPAFLRDPSFHVSKERGVHFDSVPEILKSQVLVGSMLIVVVVGDRQSDYWGLIRLLK